MKDYTMLRVLARSKGYRNNRELAKAVGCEYNGLCKKIKGESQWTTKDIQSIIRVLELTPEEVMRYFFNH